MIRMFARASAADRARDQALLDEISPDMMQKLRREWRQSGVAVGLLLLLGGIHLLRQNGSFAYESLLTSFGVLSLLLSVVLLCTACFGQSLAAQEELSYRRQRGKWRWER
jgi:hypothetical protein